MAGGSAIWLRIPVPALDRPGDQVLEPAEDGALLSGRFVGAEAVVGLDLRAAPGAGLHPAQITGAVPVGSLGWVSTTRRHSVMWPPWITNAVSAVSPTPAPHSPGPGRSVSTKVAIVKRPWLSAG